MYLVFKYKKVFSAQLCWQYSVNQPLGYFSKIDGKQNSCSNGLIYHYYVYVLSL